MGTRGTRFVYATANVAGISGSADTVNIQTGSAMPNNTVIGDFTDNAADAATTTYSTYVKWTTGGSFVAASNEPDGNGGFTIKSDSSGAPTYSTSGYVTPVIEVKPSDSRSPVYFDGSVDVTAIGSPTGSSFSAYQGTNYTGTVATFTDSADTSHSITGFSASIAWGDGNTTDGTIAWSSSLSKFTVKADTAIPFAYPDAGSFSPTVTITDPGGGTATASGGTASVYGIVVTAATISAVQDTSTGTITVGTFTDNLPGVSDYPSGYYTATIAWGDNNTSTGTISGPTDGVFTITGSHTYTYAGTFDPTIIIMSVPDGRTSSGYGEADVSGITVTGEDINAVAGTSTGTIPVASFTDNAPDAATQTYSAYIQWGDTDHSTGTIVPDGQGDGGFIVNGSHTYSTAGSYTPVVTITATDSRAGTTSSYYSANVTTITDPLPATITTGKEGASFTGAVGTFEDGTDSVPGHYSAWVDWGDGNESAGVITLSGSTFTVTGTDSFAVSGDISPTVTITDPSGATDTITDSVTVAGVIATAADPIAAVQGTSTGTITLATFNETDSSFSGDSTSDYAAYIDWGDGSSGSTGTIGGSYGAGYTVTSSGHTYDTAGTFTPTITIVCTGDGRSASVQGEVDVSGLTITGDEADGGTTYTGTIGTFEDALGGSSIIGSDYTATVTWTQDGGGSTTPTLDFNNDGGFDIELSSASLPDGVYNLGITISDGTHSAYGTASAYITTITAHSSGSAITAAQGTSVSQVMATFTDTSDTNPADYSATIAWGDGNTTPGVITYSSGFSVTGTYTYQSAGSFTPIVTITDNNGTAVLVTNPAATITGMAGSGITINPVQGVSLSSYPVATFTDNASDAGSVTRTATINWGDNTTSSGTITYSSGTYTVTGNKSGGYGANGQMPVSVTVVASDGRNLLIDSSSAYVSTISGSAYTTLTALQGEPLRSSEYYPPPLATFTCTDTVLGDFSAEIDWGDGNVSDGSISEPTTGNYVVTGNNTYAGYGTFHPIITITDSAYSNDTAQIKDTITVAQMATPTITSSSYSGHEIILNFTASTPPTCVYPYYPQFTVEAEDLSIGGNYCYLATGGTAVLTFADHGSAGGGLDSFTAYIPGPVDDPGLLPSGDNEKFRIVQTNLVNQNYVSGDSSAMTLGSGSPEGVTLTGDPTLSAMWAGSQVNLTWLDNTNQEANYLVYRSTGTVLSQAQQIATLGADVTSYQDTDPNLDPGKTYNYWVVADGTPLPSNMDGAAKESDALTGKATLIAAPPPQTFASLDKQYPGFSKTANAFYNALIAPKTKPFGGYAAGHGIKMAAPTSTANIVYYSNSKSHAVDMTPCFVLFTFTLPPSLQLSDINLEIKESVTQVAHGPNGAVVNLQTNQKNDITYNLAKLPKDEFLIGLDMENTKYALVSVDIPTTAGSVGMGTDNYSVFTVEQTKALVNLEDPNAPQIISKETLKYGYDATQRQWYGAVTKGIATPGPLP